VGTVAASVTGGSAGVEYFSDDIYSKNFTISSPVSSNNTYTFTVSGAVNKRTTPHNANKFYIEITILYIN
jgi:hypothetical protein